MAMPGVLLINGEGGAGISLIYGTFGNDDDAQPDMGKQRVHHVVINARGYFSTA
jgi:hypothetical protein